MTRRGNRGADFARTLDATHYYVRAIWLPGASLAETGKHQYLLTGSGNRIELTAWFSPRPIAAEPDSAAAVESASRDHCGNTGPAAGPSTSPATTIRAPRSWSGESCFPNT